MSKQFNIKKPDIEEILKNNPGVDRRKLGLATQLHEDLQKAGVVRRGYRVHVRSIRPADIDAERDPRTVNVRRSR